MQIFNENKLFNFNPSKAVYKNALNVSIKLGNINLSLRNSFKKDKIASRIFAFVELKYSSKIEGIYTTLFDVANNGK